MFALREQNPVLRRHAFFSGRRNGDGPKDVLWLRPDGGQGRSTASRIRAAAGTAEGEDVALGGRRQLGQGRGPKTSSPSPEVSYRGRESLAEVLSHRLR